MQSTNTDQKWLETVFSIAICCQSSDKWQSKTVTSDYLSTFLDSIDVFDCRLSGVIRAKVHLTGQRHSI